MNRKMPGRTSHAGGVMLIFLATTAMGLQTLDDEAQPVQSMGGTPESVQQAGEVMQTGSLAHWRVQLASICTILLLFAFFLFGWTEKSRRLLGGIFRKGQKDVPDCENPEDLDLSNRSKNGADLSIARILDEEKEPLIMPLPRPQPAQDGLGKPPHQHSVSIFECPIYRYGGLDAALEAVNGFRRLEKRKVSSPSCEPRVSLRSAAPAEESTARDSAKQVLDGVYFTAGLAQKS